MRKITINQYSLPDKGSILSRQKQYCVWLQNHCRFLFSNNKEAIKFLVETSKFLNLKLFQINDLLSEIFCIYRDIWFYLDYQDDNYLFQRFRDVNKSLSLAHSITSDNSRPFHFFYNVLSTFKEILGIVIQIQKARNNWAEINKMESLTSRINYIEQELKNYKKDHPSFIISSLESQGLGLSFKMKDRS